MSYCVNCGVKLAEYEKDCPLCATPVYNPNKIKDKENEEKYMCSDWVVDVEIKSLNGPFLASMILIGLMIPMIATSIIYYCFYHELSWPTIVLGALACVWFYIILPFTFPKMKPYIYALINIIVSALYLLLVNYCTGFHSWYLPLGLPLILLIGSISCLTIYIIRRKNKRRIEKVGWIILLGACLACGIDIIVTHFRTHVFILGWAWYVSIPLIIFGVTLLIIAHNVRVSEWLKRKLFI